MPNKINKDKKSEDTKTPLIETEEIVIEETEENIEKVSLENIEEKAEEKPEKPKDVEEKTHDVPPKATKNAEEFLKADDENPKDKDLKNEFFNLDDKPSSHKKNKKIFAMGIIVTAFILFATGILLFLILGSGGVKEEKTVKEETITEEATPTPEKLNKEDWSFEVLNGSGIAGLAAKKAKALEDAGYTVVKKGNADNQKYEVTELYVTEEMESKAELLIEDLKAEFKVTEVKGKLTTDSTATARIILGKDQE